MSSCLKADADLYFFVIFQPYYSLYHDLIPQTYTAVDHTVCTVTFQICLHSLSVPVGEWPKSILFIFDCMT